jgi:hypothetical protein
MLPAIGCCKTNLLSYRFIHKWAYFISLGTSCFEPIPHPLGVVTAALRSQATALRRSDEKTADVVLVGSDIAG